MSRSNTQVLVVLPSGAKFRMPKPENVSGAVMADLADSSVQSLDDVKQVLQSAKFVAESDRPTFDLLDYIRAASGNRGLYDATEARVAEILAHTPSKA